MDINSIINDILDIFFPPRCVGCRKLSQAPICNSCLKNVEYIKLPYCKICGKTYDNRFEGSFCHDCYLKKTPFDMARSITIYGGIMKKALHNFKYRNKKVLRSIFGQLMADYLENQKDIDMVEIDLITPVPLSKKKLKTREYNQAKLLAEELSKQVQITLDDEVLKRTRETTPQFHLSRKERLENLKDAFTSSTEVEGKSILLVDDIFTTGSTVKEASKALKKAGAKKVFVLTLARTI